MISGLEEYYDKLFEKKAGMKKEDKDYFGVSDTMRWCKDIWRAIEKLPNRKDMREEMTEKMEDADFRAKCTGDIGYFVERDYWRDLLRRYNFVEKAVKERLYL